MVNIRVMTAAKLEHCEFNVTSVLTSRLNDTLEQHSHAYEP